MPTFKFVLRTERITGRTLGKGKNAREEVISKRKELTKPQALAYFKRTKGAIGFVGPVNKGYRIIYCKTGKFAVENFTGRFKVKLFPNFQKALNHISKNVKKETIKVRIMQFPAIPTEEAEKYQYNV